jgi:hypothetical protein
MMAPLVSVTVPVMPPPPDWAWMFGVLINASGTAKCALLARVDHL